MIRLLLLLSMLLSPVFATAGGSPTPTPQAPHDVLQAVGPQAAHIVDLWRIFLGTCTLVFGAILAALLWALWRQPKEQSPSPADVSAVRLPEPRVRRSVATAVLASSLLLVMLAVASFFTDQAIGRMSLANAVTIDVTGHQWWWTVRYIGGGPADEVITANEIHVPAGRPVVVQLRSDDVIHSLWLPNLAGKKDLIPGRTALMSFQADKPGVYRGQCAEFCGYQHALMGLVVVAQPQAEFDAWLAAQRQPAGEPADAQAQRGKTLFETRSCAMCHTVSGTLAQGKRAPDLTHVASRLSLASGTLPNTRDSMASWIREPQTHKPGTNMPATALSNEDLQALVTYLEGLK